MVRKTARPLQQNVHAVLVERGLSDTRIGKLLMSATVVTDLCSALALSAIFLKPNLWFPAFLVVEFERSASPTTPRSTVAA